MTETVETTEQTEPLSDFAQDILNKTAEQNGEAKAEPKRKRGRPKGSGNKQQANPDAPPDAVLNEDEVALVAMIFYQAGTIATAKLEVTPYDPARAEQLARAAIPVANKYLPGVMAQWGLEITLCIVAGSQIFGVYMEHQAKQAEKAEAEAEQPDIFGSNLGRDVSNIKV